jgi:hypothetical protein
MGQGVFIPSLPGAGCLYGSRAGSQYCSFKLWMQDTGCMMQDRNGPDSGYLVPEPGTWYLVLHGST